MNLLYWNCRGLGNLRSVRALRDLMRRQRPQILFLIETKLFSKEMEGVKIKLGFRYGLFVDCVGRAGGLVMLWE